MAPTGPITSWQILLEIRAASSRSVGWARSVIGGPLFLLASRARPAAHEIKRTPRWPTKPFAQSICLDTRFAPRLQGQAPALRTPAAESIAFASLRVRARLAACAALG